MTQILAHSLRHFLLYCSSRRSHRRGAVVLNVMGHVPLLANGDGGVSLQLAFKDGVGTNVHFGARMKLLLKMQAKLELDNNNLVAFDLSKFQFMPIVESETNNMQ